MSTLLKPGDGVRTLLRDDHQTGHRACVERVILRVREHPAQTFSLSEMANIAFMSPYHFNRVFRRVTGLAPRVFQLLLRLETAKELLASTEMSIADVCFATGYSSLGTFTRRFTEMVGFPPNRFRRLAGESSTRRREPVRREPLHRSMPGGASLAGDIRIPAQFAGRVFVGAFPSPIPRGCPASCAVFEAPADRFCIDGLPAGAYYVSAVAIAEGAHGVDAVRHDAALRARCGPIAVCADGVTICSPLVMRPAEVTDVPILSPLGIIEADVTASLEMASFKSPMETRGALSACTT